MNEITVVSVPIIFSFAQCIMIGTLILLAGLALLVRSFMFWRRQGDLLMRSTFIGPEPPKTGKIAFGLLCRLLRVLFVGRVKVTGRENTKLKFRAIITANHQSYLDFVVVRMAYGYHYRHVVKRATVTRSFAWFASMIGTVSADVELGRAVDPTAGQKIVEADAKLLVEPRAKLLKFLQGKLKIDNVIDEKDFRTGAVRAMALAAEVVDPESLFVIPMAIIYERDPAHATIIRRLVYRFYCYWMPEYIRNEWKGIEAPLHTVFGARITVGSPVPFTALPIEPREATNVLCHTIESLLSE